MENIKNLLCIRTDNFGDVLMSSPAIRAIKQTFKCKITLLTSSMGSIVVPLIKEIDDLIVFDTPWVAVENCDKQQAVLKLVEKLSNLKFDACIIFNTFSQNPLPAALIAWLSQIPFRIGYCRENPYNLLNKWIPDKEPYNGIQHQVERDLHLAECAGAIINDKNIHIAIPQETENHIRKKLQDHSLETQHYLVIHIGVSEEKRKYPIQNWIAVCQTLIDSYALPLVFTGSINDKEEVASVIAQIKGSVHDFSGELSLAETASVIENAKTLISVNTGIVHIAAATKTPCVVLYAQTNPQHTPWMAPHVLLEYSVSENLKSKNEVLRWVDTDCYKKSVPYPTPEDVCKAFLKLNGKE